MKNQNFLKHQITSDAFLQIWKIKVSTTHLAMGLWAQGRNMWVSQNMGLLWRWWKWRVGTYSTVSPCAANRRQCAPPCRLCLNVTGEGRYKIQGRNIYLFQEGLDVPIEPRLVPESHPGRTFLIFPCFTGHHIGTFTIHPTLYVSNFAPYSNIRQQNATIRTQLLANGAAVLQEGGQLSPSYLNRLVEVLALLYL